MANVGNRLLYVHPIAHRLSTLVLGGGEWKESKSGIIRGKAES
jgi:hypothetical protein